MKKAQAQFIRYTLIIFFSIIVLIGISALVYTFYRRSLEKEIRAELKQLVLQTSDSLIKLYDTASDSKVRPENYSSSLLGETNLNLPGQVGGRSYDIILVSPNPIWTSVTNFTIDGETISSVVATPGAKVLAKTKDPLVEIEHEIPNIDAAVQGRSENGKNSTLRYYRHNVNNTLYDTIILGESEIIIKIIGIS
jgi:hypothetical protein